MAIYHMSVQTIGRSTGASALAAAAYRSGEKLDEFDYSKRHHEIDGPPQIFAPENAPSWCFDRGKLWAEVEKSEKRKDAQLCREINLALPLELNPDERRELLEEYARTFTAQGMIADTAIHKSKDGQNPHAHIMLTTRELTPEGFGKKRRDWNSRERLEQWREKWADLANKALERAGHPERIDHRTLAAQGIDREPTRHQGKHATHMKGEALICQYNQAIKEEAQLAAEIARIDAEMEKLGKSRQNDLKRASEPPRAPHEAKIASLPKTRQELRQEDKADEKASREKWEATRKVTPEWQADEKILAIFPDKQSLEKAYTASIIAHNNAKDSLEAYQEKMDRMGTLAKLTKRKEIQNTLTTLQDEFDRAKSENKKIGAQLHEVRMLEVKKTEIHAKRREQWEKSPEGRAYQARHEERRKQILALEKEERERNRTRERVWSR